MVYSWCILMFPCPLYFLQIGSWNQGFDYYHSNKTIAGGLFFYQEACNAKFCCIDYAKFDHLGTVGQLCIVKVLLPLAVNK